MKLTKIQLAALTSLISEANDLLKTIAEQNIGVQSDTHQGLDDPVERMERRIMAAFDRCQQYAEQFPQYKALLGTKAMTKTVLRRALGNDMIGFEVAIRSLIGQNRLKAYRLRNPDNNYRITKVWRMFDDPKELAEMTAHYAKVENMTDDQKHEDMVQRMRDLAKNSS